MNYRMYKNKNKNNKLYFFVKNVKKYGKHVQIWLEENKVKVVMIS